MFAKLFGQRLTTRTDIVAAVAGAALACFKAYDTIHTYKAEQKALNDKNKKDNS